VLRRPAALIAAVLVAVAFAPEPARAAECGRVVILTLPGVTWRDVVDARAHGLLALAEEGAVASMSVRTNEPVTTYAGGFLTIGAGTRADPAPGAGAIADLGEAPALDPGEPPTPPRRVAQEPTFLRTGVTVASFEEIQRAAATGEYSAEVGALAGALATPVVAIGNAAPSPSASASSWAALAAMDTTGRVDLAAAGAELLVPDPSAPFGVRAGPALDHAITEALAIPCSTVVIEPGDLARADEAVVQGAAAKGARYGALARMGQLVDRIRSSLEAGRDLLLVVTPTSPASYDDTHLGVAIAWGGGFPAGTVLGSASTRHPGIVTLSDIAPTVLRHHGVKRPPSMLGRPFVPHRTEAAGGSRISTAIDLDDEAVFVHQVQPLISAAFVVFQIVLFGVALLILWRRRGLGGWNAATAAPWLEKGALFVVAFPLATYLLTPLPAHELGGALFGVALIAAAAALVFVATLLGKTRLQRLLLLTAATVSLFVIDLAFGLDLQLNAVFGNDPIWGGRFTGLGNIAFAVLGATTILTAALLVHMWPRRRWTMRAVIALFAVVVFVDGAPALGSDVGGVLALVPVFAITVVLLADRRPSFKTLLLAALGAVAALGVFLVLDLSRPPEARTHLARLYEDIASRGPGVFVDVVVRKLRTSLLVFSKTIWSYLVPPVLAAMAYLLLTPRGEWQRIAERYPRLRAGLIGCLLLAVLGFAVNDSGVVVPAMVLSFLAPMALSIHLCLQEGQRQLPADAAS